MELADFFGDWQLERDIRHADGSRARFSGSAQWVPDDKGGAVYLERGWLEMPGQGRFQAERRYLWTADFQVFFDDGRFFHKVPAGGGRADHWCNPDQYVVEYQFDRWPDWRCTWTVTGPQKDYTMVNRYAPKWLGGS